MLKLIKIKDPSLKLGFLSGFQPEKTAFICSDIKNKKFLENQLFKQYNTLSSSSVLRADEFYKLLFASLNKKWSLKSDSFVQQILNDFLGSQEHTKHLIQSQVFFNWFQFCVAFFLQNSSHSLFKEWFYFKDQNLFPKEWLKLFEEFFNLLESKNILYESGVKAFLLSEMPFLKPSFFEKEILIVDLGFSMNLCEKDIYKELSKFKKVYVLAPILELNFLVEKKGYDFYSEWEKELDKKNVIHLKSDTLFSKDFFLSSQTTKLSSSDSTQSSSPPQSSAPPQSSSGFSSNISENAPAFFKIENKTKKAEVENAVRQASVWLNQGIHPEKIVIYAPSIEEYWFILKYQLEKLSVPYKKTHYTSLIEFPEIKFTLSSLRFYLNLFDFQDLETFYFYKNPKRNFTRMKQKHFEVLNKNIIKKDPFKKRDSKTLVSGFDFVDWTVSLFPSHCSKSAFFKILKKFKTKDQLSFQSWLFLLESEVLSQDIELEKENSFGISCLSFNAFNSVTSSHVILLGLNESAFKETSLLKEDSLSSLLHDLGFGLDFKLSREKEKSLLWFLQSSHHKEVYFSHYLYDLEGNIEAKAFLFMFLQQYYSLKSHSLVEEEKFNLLESLEPPAQTGQIKQAESGSKIKNSSSGKPDQLKQAQILRVLLKDKSKKQIQAIEKAFFESKTHFFHPRLPSLSVSRLKKYYDCPFKYAADKIFYVKEKQSLKQELSPLIKGVAAHKLFNSLLEKHPDLNISEKQKEDLIEELIPAEDIFIFKKEQVILLKIYLKKLIDDFLLKEKQERAKHPSIKALAFEANLKAFWNQKKGELSSKGEYLFKGSIDRIDRDEKQKSYLIRDYKASLNHLTHVSSWIKKYEIQLIFYAQALEKGLVENLAPSEVSALFYSAYNEDFKAKAFIEKESKLDDLIEGRKSSYMKPREELTAVTEALNKKTQELVAKIERGEFSPQPRDKSLCQSCSYRNWCRVESYV